MQKHCIIFLLAGFSLLFSCSSEKPREIASDRNIELGDSSQIFGGEDVEPREFRTVVGLVGTDGRVFCSGFLVSSKLVVTAASCIAGKEPASIKVHVGNGKLGFVVDERLFPVEKGESHPQFGFTETQPPKHDIAWLLLSYAPYLTSCEFNDPIFDYDELTEVIKLGARIKAFGFGCQDDKTPCTGGVKQSVDLNINGISGDLFSFGAQSIGPTSGADVGGPVFVRKGAKWKIIGLNLPMYSPTAEMFHTNACWVSSSSNINIPGNDLHCYDRVSSFDMWDTEDFDYYCQHPQDFFQIRTVEVLKAAADMSTCVEAAYVLGEKTKLNLSNKYLVDLKPLAKLKELKKLDLSGNGRAFLAPLVLLPKLETLVIDPTPSQAKEIALIKKTRTNLKVISPSNGLNHD